MLIPLVLMSVTHIHVEPSIRVSSPLQMILVNPLEGTEWDRLVASHPLRTAFHSSAWARVLHLTYGHRPFYLHFVRGGKAVALVPLMEVSSAITGRRGVCLPFSDYCSPLWHSKSDTEFVHAELIRLAEERNWKHLELRLTSQLFQQRAHRMFEGHYLDLSTGSGGLEQRMDESVRRSIRKARRSGVVTTVCHSLEAMHQYERLHAMTRQRQGLPPQPHAFFSQIYQQMIMSGLGCVVLAHYQGCAIAGAVFLHAGDQAIYKYGASNSSSWLLRPNHLVMWTAMQHLAQKGCRTLHFGRTSSRNEGLSRFKRSWGSSSGKIAYHRYELRQHDWNGEAAEAAEHGFDVFRWMPSCLNRWAGMLLYPHMD